MTAPTTTDTKGVWFEGNFKEYDADLRRRKGAEAETPHRIAYKKLVRA
jgi:energy-dependent translational throttle protein EttA